MLIYNDQDIWIKFDAVDIDKDVRNVTHSTRPRWVGRNSGPIFSHFVDRAPP